MQNEVMDWSAFDAWHARQKRGRLFRRCLRKAILIVAIAEAAVLLAYAVIRLAGV